MQKKEKETLNNIIMCVPDAGSFILFNNTNLQKQFLPGGFKSARYFKVAINSAYSASYTQIAEINAFLKIIAINGLKKSALLMGIT